MVARETHILKVAGSIPAPAIMNHLEIMKKGIFPEKWEYQAKFDFEALVLQEEEYQIISFQGSKSWIDYLLDFLFIPVPYRGRFIHLGVSLGMRKAWKEYISQNVDFNKKTYITGHSLGGGRAQAFHIIYNDKFRDAESILFASLRVEWFLSWIFDKIFREKLKMTRYENRKDLVPKLPFRVLGFFHRGERVRFGEKSIWPLFDQGIHAEKFYLENIKEFYVEKNS